MPLDPPPAPSHLRDPSLLLQTSLLPQTHQEVVRIQEAHSDVSRAYCDRCRV
jgi:hypothetical protein